MEERVEGLLTLLLRTVKDRVGLGRKSESENSSGARRGAIAQGACGGQRQGSERARCGFVAQGGAKDAPPTVRRRGTACGGVGASIRAAAAEEARAARADLSVPLTMATVHRFIILNSTLNKRSRTLQ